MRVYALLCGILLTSGYAYAAQVAVASTAAGQRAVPAPTVTTDPAGELWYGGVLDPITVESRGGSPQAAAVQDRVLTRPTYRCGGSERASVRTIS